MKNSMATNRKAECRFGGNKIVIKNLRERLFFSHLPSEKKETETKKIVKYKGHCRPFWLYVSKLCYLVKIFSVRK